MYLGRPSEVFATHNSFIYDAKFRVLRHALNKAACKLLIKRHSGIKKLYLQLNHYTNKIEEALSMTVSEAIQERRSIRRFKSGETVSHEQIEKLLEAAMLAPSACNSRPWEFVVVQNREKLNELSEQHPYAKMLTTASIAIVVCALPESQEGIADGFFQQDCAAATENILLQAVELGLAGCWCGVYPKEELLEKVRTILDIASTPFNVIAIGIPDSTPKARGFFEDSKVRYIK